MHLFKHYSEKHNPNCVRLYWKTDRDKILDILYHKIDGGQLNKLIAICREKNNPCRGKWTDKPNRTPVMVRTSGFEFFATLNTLKKAHCKACGYKDKSKLEYYSHCLYKKYSDSTGELRTYYDNLWHKVFLSIYYDEVLTEDIEKEIKEVINE